MIFQYGVSLQGRSHIKMNQECQDAHKIRTLSNGWVIAAIADGVGSAKNAKDGATIAVDSFVTYCDQKIVKEMTIQDAVALLKDAYKYAFHSIEQNAEEKAEQIESYDTTLTSVVFDGKDIVYGHAGDGGIIGLFKDGQIKSITRPQKGDDGISVLPLRSGEAYWKFGIIHSIASVILVTDGLLNTLCPYLLRGNKHHTNEVYKPLAFYFCDSYGLKDHQNQMAFKRNTKRLLMANSTFQYELFYHRLEGIYHKYLHKECYKVIQNIKKNNFPVLLPKNESDDLTIVCLINLRTKVLSQSLSYYEEPDWIKLKNEWNKIAYPSLYKK